MTQTATHAYYSEAQWGHNHHDSSVKTLRHIFFFHRVSRGEDKSVILKRIYEKSHPNFTLPLYSFQWTVVGAYGVTGQQSAV